MTTTTNAPAVPAQQRRRVRTRPERPAWFCENCAQPNGGRRRRCLDCGTSRE